jgi:uroporphyrinogen-III decarboxylase
MKMPASSYFFDSIDRSCDFDVNNPDPRGDFGDAFKTFDDNTARYLENESKNLFENTSYGVVGNFGGGGFGDVGQLPGQSIKNPKGIRRLDDWLVAHILYPDYILELFEFQADIAIKNLKIYRDAVGDRIQVIYVSGTDFGTQKSELISPEIYRKLYKPFNKKINDWIHNNTSWKTFYHSCGSIINILDDLIESGVDIINPVQCSAEGMEPNLLKSKYGDKVVFWGGAVDTQAILPFGSKEDVANQVKERLEIFTKGGGYVFSTIHNIVGNIPIDNIISMLDAIKNYKA